MNPVKIEVRKVERIRATLFCTTVVGNICDS